MGALSYFGFPETFVNWIKIMYNDINTCAINNGYISKKFTPTRGVKQGCPLSPTLFVVAVELLSLYIKHSPLINGIEGYAGNYIVSQFADDTSFAIVNKKQNLNNLFGILKEFAHISGLKINKDKTEILLLGNSDKKTVHKSYRTFIKEYINILGVKFSLNKHLTINLNYVPIVDKIQNILQLWNNRNISLAGKSTIIKTLAASKLVYCLTMLPTPPNSLIDEINGMFYSFISGGGSEKFKRLNLIGPYEKGGFKMLDLESQINQMVFTTCLNLLILCGDIETNPGPPKNKDNASNKMSFCFLNAQSIKGTDKDKTKFIDYKNMVYILRPDVFVLNETCLTKDVLTSDVIDKDLYKAYRTDRKDIRGGGF